MWAFEVEFGGGKESRREERRVRPLGRGGEAAVGEMKGGRLPTGRGRKEVRVVNLMNFTMWIFQVLLQDWTSAGDDGGFCAFFSPDLSGAAFLRSSF